MKGTDTFHLGDGYYVNVNWECGKFWTDPVYQPNVFKRYYFAWVGEDWGNPLRVANIPLRGDSLHSLNSAKQNLEVILINFIEQLKEIIHEEEYWKHN